MDNKVHVFTGKNAVKALTELPAGTPVMIKASAHSDWRQAILMQVNNTAPVIGGIANYRDDNKAKFYDGTLFEFSFRFIMNGTIKFKFNDNNPIAVNNLIRSLQGSR
jgi:hypothetical protein